jgi:hypothetical protein
MSALTRSFTASGLALVVAASSVAQTAAAASALPGGPAEIAAMHHAIASATSWRAVCVSKTLGRSSVQTYRVIRPDRVAGSVTVGASTIDVVQIGRTQYTRGTDNTWKRGERSNAEMAEFRGLATEIDKGVSYAFAQRSSVKGELVSIYRVTIPSLRRMMKIGPVQLDVGVGRGTMDISTASHLPLKASVFIPMSLTLATGTKTANVTVDCRYFDYNGKDIEISAPDMSPPLPYFPPASSAPTAPPAPTTTPSPPPMTAPSPLVTTSPSPAPSVSPMR